MTPFKSFLAFILFLAFLVPAGLSAQDQAGSLTSSDDVFFMQVKREVTKVKISILIKNPSEVAQISVERTDITGNSWGQCKYISMASVNPSDTIIRMDNYPLPGSIDVYYRLRLTSKDGVTRVYPAVKLAAVNDLAKEN